MYTPTVTIHIPQPLYRRIERLAGQTQRPIEEVVTRTLETNLPPTLEHYPAALREELLAMEQFPDKELWRVARDQISPTQNAQHSELLRKNAQGQLTTHEQSELDALTEQADQLMLRKAYAYMLLKWRGHRLPTLQELEVAS